MWLDLVYVPSICSFKCFNGNKLWQNPPDVVTSSYKPSQSWNMVQSLVFGFWSTRRCWGYTLFWTKRLHIPLMRTMVLVYLPTYLGDFVWAVVGKYTSTMEHMGMKIIKINKARKQNPRSENHTAKSMTANDWLVVTATKPSGSLIPH